MKMMLVVLAFAVLATAYASSAHAQVFSSTEGELTITAGAVNTISHDSASRLMVFGLVSNGQTRLVRLRYGTTTPPPGNFTGEPSALGEVVAKLIYKLPEAKKARSTTFGNLVITRVKYKQISSTLTYYWIQRESIVTLHVAQVAYVPKVDMGSNTRGGLVKAVIYDNEQRTVDQPVDQKVACKTYGFVSLLRKDEMRDAMGRIISVTDRPFDAYLLKQSVGVTDPDTLQPMTLNPIDPGTLTGTYDVYHLLDTVLAGTAPRIVFDRNPSPFKVEDSRIVQRGCKWWNNLQ